jgi:hypothetical protein
MTIYTPSLKNSSAASDFRYGRTVPLAEPTLAIIQRCIGQQVARLENPALAGDGHREARACLEKLVKQYRAATGRNWQSEVPA